MFGAAHEWIEIMAIPAMSEQVAELLGADPAESIVEQLVDTGASIEEITQALAALDDTRLFCVARLPESDVIVQVRRILEELPSALLDEGPVEESSGNLVEDEIELHRDEADART